MLIHLRPPEFLEIKKQLGDVSSAPTEVLVARCIVSSFNGKTTDFDSVNGSSILSETANYKFEGKGLFVDWNKLKAEYIAGGISYRKLAEKYKDEGVTFNNLKLVAAKEGWASLREQAMDKATTKMVDEVAKDISKNALKINAVADKLLDKICKLLEALEVADSQTIKQCTSALKDIKDIKGVKNAIDLKEQNARIDKLRKEIESEQTDDKPYGVVLMPPIMPAIVPPSGDEGDG